MATATTMTSVDATINYLLDQALGGPDENFVPGTAGFYKRKHAPTPVTIHDIRGFESNFSLDKQGFQLHNHTSVEKSFDDNDKIKASVYPEVEQLVKTVTGASKVTVFSHNMRRYTSDHVKKEIESLSDDARYTKVPPNMFAHVDNGPDGGLQVLNEVLGTEEAKKLCQSRWGIINVWRPIKPVQRDPLALCDLRTVADGDLVARYAVVANDYGNFAKSDNIGRRYETLQAKKNDDHRWYYASGMTPDEVLLLKIFDTNKKTDGTYQQTPHTAFPYETISGAPARESIEVRTLVFWEDQPLD